MKLYDAALSGNAYKVRLLLALRGVRYERIAVDIFGGAARTDEFRSINPFGKVPVLELDDGHHLAESGAILYYLGVGTRFLPDSTLERAQVMQWLFFEQNVHEPAVAGARRIVKFAPPERRDALPRTQRAAHAALAIVERALGDGREFVAGGEPSIADIALYAYTHLAPQGGVMLDSYPVTRAWLARVEALPGYQPMDA